MKNDAHFIVNKDKTKVSRQFNLAAAEYGTTLSTKKEYCCKNKLIVIDVIDNYEHYTTSRSVSSLDKLHIDDIKKKATELGIGPPKDLVFEKEYYISAVSLYYHQPILVTGATGVGKNYFIKMLLDSMEIHDSKIIEVNVGSESSIFESNFFGHEEGSFTNAIKKRIGYLETYNNGYIILDEAGDIPLESQKNFLQFLEDGTFIRVGSDRQSKSNAHFIFATNRNLAQMVQNGTFRKDLYHRIAREEIKLEPFNKLSDEIKYKIINNVYDIVNKELHPITNNNADNTNHKALEYDAVLFIEQFSFPGNIRGLKNLIKKLFMWSTSKKIGIEEVKKFIVQNTEDLFADTPEDKLKKVELEYYSRSKEIIEDTIKKYDRKKDAAKELGFNSTAALNKKIGSLKNKLERCQI